MKQHVPQVADCLGGAQPAKGRGRCNGVGARERHLRMYRPVLHGVDEHLSYGRVLHAQQVPGQRPSGAGVNDCLLL